MAPIDVLPQNIIENYEIHEWRHACAVLKEDFPHEWQDIIDVLTEFTLCKSYVIERGGNLSRISKVFDQAFSSRGWIEKSFSTQIVVDGQTIDSPTHKVDCYKNGIALEIEWNNKDPFFDRDLNNFRLLFDLRAVSVGIIITRSDELQDIFIELDRKKTPSTTHMSKLLPKLAGGGGGGCPVLVFGIKKSLYSED